MNIKNVLNSGEVVRFHNHAGIDKQKNSEHQWGVALIVQYVYPNCSKSLLLAAMTHDCAEYFTGDIPFPAKQANPELGTILREMEIKWEEQNDIYFDLHPDEKLVLKIADTLEGMNYCLSQVKCGNFNAKRPFRKWRKFFQEHLLGTNMCSPSAENLFETIIRKMEEL